MSYKQLISVLAALKASTEIFCFIYQAKTINSIVVSSISLHQFNAYIAQSRNIGRYCLPYSRNINRAVSVNIEISRIFYRSPRNSFISVLCFIRKLPDKFTDLHNTHTARILKQMVFREYLTATVKAFDISFYPLTVIDYLSKDYSVTSFDRATPRLSLSC